jgi:hypothetical protein
MNRLNEILSLFSFDWEIFTDDQLDKVAQIVAESGHPQATKSLINKEICIATLLDMGIVSLAVDSKVLKIKRNI